MTSPVFFDSTGKRRRLVGRLIAVLLTLILACAIGFATTIVNVPTTSALDFSHERQQPLPFKTHLAHWRHRIPQWPHLGRSERPINAAFYVPWDPESVSALRAHYDQLDWVIASNASLDRKTLGLKVHIDTPLRTLVRGRLHRPKLFLMVQNIDDRVWFGPEMSRLFHDPAKSDALIDGLIAAAKRVRWQGVIFDIENMPNESLPAYRDFLARAHPRFTKAGLLMGVTVPAGEPAWNLKRLAEAVDHVIFMNYDQHWQGGESGPIAAHDWFASMLADARSKVPPEKLIIALGNYGYDWHDGIADALTVNEAWLAARDSGARPAFDPSSSNSGFAYDEDGHKHTIWMMDAAASWNQLALLRGGIAGIALWRLGSEDPGYWEAVAAWQARRMPRLETIAPATGTDIDGSGEILRIAARPEGGSRTLDFGKDGTVIDERFSSLPSPFVVQRTGAADPKKLAITFDDGPDPDWTPRILDILKSKGMNATFFVIGENALEHPEILRRLVAEGNEVGNHSYTHPNLAEVSPLGVKLELNATQRLIEAYTGRSTRLFRAPYFGDAEPTEADELLPAALAQDRGYTIVGLHVDPDDWKTPGVQHIVDDAVRKVLAASPQRSGNIILLHDGGGRRDQTIAALPQIIDQLRARGYHFVTVSALAGLSRDTVMPPVKGADLLAVRADVGFFIAIAMLGYALRWLFFFAIALGIARAIFMTALALLDRHASEDAPTDAPQPPVSVIIPAYNEETVIVASVARVLASNYPAMEVIVADDGSKDATSALVAQHYGDDPRVRLMTLVNGGKASALNRALQHASGSIIIALDADTQFLPDTIAKLVRWFANPRVGAVAGNARVGNKINLVTRWQAIEYVTAQNVERRALDALKAITVVPGAVGAWRREALDAVGGYPEDTLAEDQDLTIAIQRAGWWVEYDVEAIALTEAPETFRALGKQRYRWSFGTLQCLWKHRDVLKKGRPRGLAWFGMPQAWLFQIVFAALSPIIDLALVISVIGTWVQIHQHGWAQTQSDVLRMGGYWLLFVAIDLLAGWIAYRLEPTRQRFPALLMIMQRFVYRQLMYGVVIRSIHAALRGQVVGWGKLVRTGSVTVPPGQ
ncbi:MAG: glycosyltransferase [Sphingobium sp.]|nr:glycosyltransferase [Sphingobium sp.]